MTFAVMPHPLDGAISRTIPRREADPEIPAGQPVITRLGAYTHRQRGEAVAFLCRTCRARYAGETHATHAALRAHWVAEHKPAVVVSLTKAAPKAEPAKPTTKRVNLPHGRASIPCTTPMTRGDRAGEPCGRGSVDGTCAQHHPHRMEAQRTINRDRRREPADLTAWPKNRACDHCGGTFVVPTRRHERSRYCSQTCGNKVRNGRRGRGAAA